MPIIANFRLSNRGILILIFLFYCILSYVKFYDVLNTVGLALTNYGDGIGTISSLFTYSDEFSNGHWKVLKGDEYRPLSIGAGLLATHHSSLFWRWNAVLLGLLFSADNVYDINGVIGFVLIGFFGFMLLKEVGVSPLFSFFGSILLTHMDVFQARLNGHLLGLGIYYMPLLLLWAGIRASKSPSISRWALFAAVNTLNLMVNEYYGYFGAIFAFALCTGYIIVYRRAWIRNKVLGLYSFLVFFTLSVTFLVLAFPQQIGSKLFWSSSGPEQLPPLKVAHSWPEFVHYSVRNPLALFEPNTARESIQGVLGSSFFSNDLPEFSYRIGLFLPVTILICIVLLTIRTIAFLEGSDTRRIIKIFLVWLAAGVWISLFGLTPNFSISLVSVTSNIAPMFRVGARAYIYTDIAVVVLFSLLASYTIYYCIKLIFKNSPHNKKFHSAIFLFFSCILFVGAFKDVSRSGILQQYPALALPGAGAYSQLAEYPDALLLELPFYSPVGNPPEINYSYFFNRVYHKKPIVNLSYSGWGNEKYRSDVHEFSESVNQPNDEIIEKLFLSGVYYFVVNNNQKYDFDAITTSRLLTKIAEDPTRKIYKIRDELESQLQIPIYHPILQKPYEILPDNLKYIQGCGPALGNIKRNWRWCSPN